MFQRSPGGRRVVRRVIVWPGTRARRGRVLGPERVARRLRGPDRAAAGRTPSVRATAASQSLPVAKPTEPIPRGAEFDAGSPFQLTGSRGHADACGAGERGDRQRRRDSRRPRRSPARSRSLSGPGAVADQISASPAWRVGALDERPGQPSAAHGHALAARFRAVGVGEGQQQLTPLPRSRSWAVVIVDSPVSWTTSSIVTEPTRVPTVTGMSAAVPMKPRLSVAWALR